MRLHYCHPCVVYTSGDGIPHSVYACAILYCYFASSPYTACLFLALMLGVRTRPRKVKHVVDTYDKLLSAIFIALRRCESAHVLRLYVAHSTRSWTRFYCLLMGFVPPRYVTEYDIECAFTPTVAWRSWVRLTRGLITGTPTASPPCTCMSHSSAARAAYISAIQSGVP